MSKRKQPERSAKNSKAETKKNKKEKNQKAPKTQVPESNPLKRAKVEDSALDQLKLVCLLPKYRLLKL